MLSLRTKSERVRDTYIMSYGLVTRISWVRGHVYIRMPIDFELQVLLSLQTKSERVRDTYILWVRDTYIMSYEFVDTYISVRLSTSSFRLCCHYEQNLNEFLTHISYEFVTHISCLMSSWHIYIRTLIDFELRVMLSFRTKSFETKTKQNISEL